MRKRIHYVLLLIHKPTVLTSESNVTFVEKVKLNDTVRARAKVVKHSENYYHIDVTSYVKEILVLKVILKCSI